MSDLSPERFDRQAREHGAWLDIAQEMVNLGIEPNDAANAKLVRAIQKWGEELHRLRLDDPTHDDKALAEAREAYEGQYERGTYPEEIRRG